MAEIAIGDGEWRANARLAGLAFKRLDQRRFFAADIGAGAQMNLDVEIEARRASDRRAQEAGPPHAR